MNEAPRREGFIDADAKEAVDPVLRETQLTEQAKPESEWPIRVKLVHKPIRNNKNELVNELSFREPTGGDINRYGNPVRIDMNGDVIIDERKMSMMMGSLAGVLTPFLEAMDPRDWNSCAYRLRSFFLPDPEAWL